MKMKSVKILGKKIPILAILMIAILSTGVVSAAIVNYLSNTVTKPVAVSSPITISGEIMYWPGKQIYQLNAENGRAEWSTDQSSSEEYSVKLYTAGGEGSYGLVNILPIEPILLQSLTTDPSYWVYEPTVYPNRHPYVNIILDRDGNPDTGDIDCLEGVESQTFALEQPLAATWTEMKEAAGYTDSDNSMGSGSYLTFDTAGTLAEWKTYMADAYPNAVVIRVQIRFGNWGDPAGAVGPVYVDDITVGDVTYDLEPVIKTFGDGASFDFYAGDSFTVTVNATNHANQGMPLDIMLVLEGPGDAWTYIDGPVANKGGPIWLPPGEVPKHGCFASGIYEANINPLSDAMVYVTEDGVYTLATVYGGGIGPGDSNIIGFEISVNPVLAPGEYTFHILAVTPYSEVAAWYNQVYGNAAAALQQYINDIIDRTLPAPAPPD